MFKVTKEPLNVQEVNTLVKRSTDGAVVTFDGIVRDNFDGRAVRYLEYEAYAEMAEKKMVEIATEVRQKFAVGKIAMVHRIGRLEIGEAAVVIAVAAPHRAEALEAFRYAIDTLNRSVPIWKKEFDVEGGSWVEENP